MDKATGEAASPPRLLDLVQGRLRTLHYSYRTEQQYLGWIRRFILFHGKRHPTDMGAVEVEGFLTHLAVDRQVSASTQNQALAAILFLYQKVLEIELPWLDGVVRAKRSRHLPVVLSAKEVRAVLAKLDGEYWLVGNVLYGGGLRLLEALRLRVKDLHFEYRQIHVRSGKGDKDRVTIMPEAARGATAIPLAESTATARNREKERIRRRRDSVRARAQVSAGLGPMGVAVCVSGALALA